VATLFISDLHLDAGRPGCVERFLAFVAEHATRAERLYVLGDLFEVWIGDDDDDPKLRPIIDALARLTASGVACAVMHGNRDFLLGERFAAATGCRLLGDYERIDVNGEPVLLTHGDLLCSDDVDYQKLRTLVRGERWQREFLAKPVAERRAIAAALRAKSMTETAMKPEDIMDVNQRTVEQAMRDAGVRTLVHGHTHRPAVHRFTLDGRPATRIVLGAWHDAPTVAWWDRDGFRLETP